VALDGSWISANQHLAGVLPDSSLGLLRPFVQNLARKKYSSVDVNLLADGEDSSEEELTEEQDDGQPQISSDDDSKHVVGRGIPSTASAKVVGPTLQVDSESEDTVDWKDYRPSKHGIWDFKAAVAGMPVKATKGPTELQDGRGKSSGRQTAASAQGYKAKIPLSGKPKVCC
jgi:hypothetical protein